FLHCVVNKVILFLLFSYSIAQLPPGERDAKLAQLTQALETLTHVARQLRAQRDRGGALELEGVEVRAQLDEDKNITALVPRQPLEVHETVGNKTL
uniref:Uncharacterized protein n=1 Tax=Hucho hucho TaxID=62062 RepID=A0A4W5KMV7_9TELE